MGIRGKADFAGGAEGDSAARTLVDGLSDGAGSCSVFFMGYYFFYVHAEMTNGVKICVLCFARLPDMVKRR